MMSIGAVKAVEIGDGTAAARARGSENNDDFCLLDGKITKATNHAGGILGGISDGSEIRITLSVKPTPSIAQPQKTVTNTGEETELSIRGRHDPLIAARATVVAESMAALTLVDHLFKNMSSRMEHIVNFYQKPTETPY